MLATQSLACLFSAVVILPRLALDGDDGARHGDGAVGRKPIETGPTSGGGSAHACVDPIDDASNEGTSYRKHVENR